MNQTKLEINFRFGLVRVNLNYPFFRIERVIFKCEWFDNRWVKVDGLGFTVVDINQVGHKFNCFILASYPKQVLYAKYQVDPLNQLFVL